MMTLSKPNATRAKRAWLILPTVDCWPGVYSAGEIGSVGAGLQIQQPAPGQSVDGVIPIIGTAHFNPEPGRELSLLYPWRPIR